MQSDKPGAQVPLARLGLAATLLLVLASNANATPMNLPDAPLFVDGSKTALVQLVVERDNKLFFEAYPSYEDIDGDGELDIRYKPEKIDYYGYFASDYCYSHNGANFYASSHASNKKCLSSSDGWSGDFLNYLTMTRMDIMLRALYGGKRLIDTAEKTVLRRAFVPWENHTWGIEYSSEAVDGFRIDEYSPLSQPGDGSRHLLATNSFVEMSNVPYLRIRENSDDRIWDWVDKERTQGDGWSSSDIIVDVEVCRASFLEESCSQYPDGSYKPTGLLHEYGENNSMYFSLITGSYENNLQGGVMRQTMSSFGEEEVDPATGQFLNNGGIVNTLDAIQIPNDYYDSTVQNDCGWLWHRPFENGECRAWGNPISEMMYEGMRYLAGEQTPTPSFHTTSGMDQTLGLSVKDWDDPYSSSQPYSQCSASYQLVISDPSPSFDGDQLPGSYFSNFSESSLDDLHVGELADFISGHEAELPGLKFIGESNGVADDAPTAKNVTSFKTIRGIAPEAPHRQGSYYAPSISYYGYKTDIRPDIVGNQTVGNFTLALGSPLPTIDVEVGEQTITFAPFAKTVDGCNKDFEAYSHYPTNAIVGFVVEDLTSSSGSFRVSFEDMAQGADNDMDALTRYEYEVVGDEVKMTLTSIEASGCYVQHMGYTVSGSSADGVYLLVRDADTNANKDPDFELDVPPGLFPGDDWEDGEALPLTSERTFSASTAPAAEVLKSPLWYAAKWGGFNDANDDGVPQESEWDSNDDGDPDNFFQVTNPTRMEETLRSVFKAISEASADASAVGVSSGSLTSGSRIYEASFQSGFWYGELSSRGIDTDGNLADDIDWDANVRLQKQIDDDSRQILSYKPSTQTGIAFRWPGNTENPSETELDETQSNFLSLDPITDLADDKGPDRLSYVRGQAFSDFREREKPLGDIVHSTPQLVGPPAYYYPDDWGDGEPESSEPYSEYGTENADRQRVLYVGANDGMLHAFDAGEYKDGTWTAGSGDELFAYVPSRAFEELTELTSDNYQHKYYVDATPNIGDAMVGGEWRSILVSGMGRGGQGIFALDVTNPETITEDNAESAVLWEFTEADDAQLGYTYDSPLIARMHNGKWAAIFGNGYNSTQNDDYQAAQGIGAVFIVDLETGELISKLAETTGLATDFNGIQSPTAVDLDGDNIVDIIYTGDLLGRVVKFDVRSDDPDDWSIINRVGNKVIRALPETGFTLNVDDVLSITSQVTVGSHPTGEGVMIYFGTGKYLEPDDQNDSSTLNRIYAIWDREPFENNDLTSSFPGSFLQQSIESESSSLMDTDDDGVEDYTIGTRTSTTHAIDWDSHLGWYIELDYPSTYGEQVITRPLLREGKLIVSTHIPAGNECSPDQSGWLMILDAASGAMPAASIDINGDGLFNEEDIISGVQNINNPLASPTIVSTQLEDVILTDSADGSGASSTSLDASSDTGRISWRELEP